MRKHTGGPYRSKSQLSVFMTLGRYNPGGKCSHFMYKNNDSLNKVQEGNGCIKKCEIWNIGYWYMYINSSIVNDVTSNGEGRGRKGSVILWSSQNVSLEALAKAPLKVNLIFQFSLRKKIKIFKWLKRLREVQNN